LSLASFFLISGPFIFGIAYVLSDVLAGSYFTAAASLPMVLFPRLRFTQFVSAAGIVQSVSTIALGLSLGPMLDLTGRSYVLCSLIAGVFAAAGLAMLTVIQRNFRARETDTGNAVT
jgi:maltose/moltooligosaccharide transporter